MGKIIKKLSYGFLHHVLFGIKEYNKENIKDEPAIIVPNHTSDFDGPVLWSSFDNISIMAKKECFENKLLAKLLTSVDVMKVDRQDLIGANKVIDMAVDYFKDSNKAPNRKFLLFPQGTISDINITSVRRIKSGAFIIAALSNTPLIPVFHEQPRVFRRNRIVYGEKMYVSLEDVYEDPEAEKKRINRKRLKELKALWQAKVLALQLKATELHPRPIRKLKLKEKHRMADANQ